MGGDRRKGERLRAVGERDEGRGDRGEGRESVRTREQHVHKSKAVWWSTSTVVLAFVV